VDIVILIVSGFYFTFLLLVWYNWTRIKVNPSSSFTNVTVSVIIPSRNEEDNIRKLLDDLAESTYKKNNFEIIVVNDHSTDSTWDIVSNWVKEHSAVGLNIKLVQLEDEKGKKAAISKGISKATGEVIVTTDADCRISGSWINEIAGGVGNSELVFGPVMLLDDGSFFSRLQSLEIMVLQVVGAATWNLGFPTMCNGANLAYKKKAFEKVQGFSGNQHIASGDDEFLMHKIYRVEPGKIQFIKSRDAIVYTQPLQSVVQFVNQRKRWAGKWKGYNHAPSRLLAIFIFLVNLGFTIGMIGIFLEFMGLIIMGGIFLFKIILEFLLLNSIRKFFSVKISIGSLILLQVIYPLYVVFFSIVSQIGGYYWKGRLLKG